ncbi:hypothetical protein CPB84DRAFT_1846562 [Gymnopilus junonius]|uniref:Uncharacterized protein n=1 Tax=Gymnopilus junonius TaxID=109634 RepID=A0A9P5TPG3_GYMJU|nr:hypothetical protein CPB84DRAFT_1846562 [Gymnopilus junonius]
MEKERPLKLLSPLFAKANVAMAEFWEWATQDQDSVHAFIITLAAVVGHATPSLLSSRLRCLLFAWSSFFLQFYTHRAP